MKLEIDRAWAWSNLCTSIADMSSSSSLYLIDGVSPFFRGLDRTNIDWSKIPWDRFDAMSSGERSDFFIRVREDFETYSRSVVKIGYNGIILDDVFHLSSHEFYEDSVAERIEEYREEFSELFRLIRQEGLQVYLTMDLMDISPAVEKKIGRNEKKRSDFLAGLLESFFTGFPDVAGIILRKGQKYSCGDERSFWSRPVLKSPEQLNRCLKSLLPVFERHEKKCIFRAGSNTDLRKVFSGIESRALILSLPYNNAGAFRFGSLNRDFFATEIPTIIELQARREHEGCGEYPAFIGYQYEKLAAELKSVAHVAGISVSCQTGGLSPFRRLAFIDDNAIWIEINAFVTLRIFKYGELVEEAVSRIPDVASSTALMELLRLSEEAIRDLLYVPDFARRQLYFFKLRFGPQIGVYGNHILLSDSIRRLLMKFVNDPEACIRSGEATLARIRRMRMLALECNLPEADIEFMESIFDILAFSREYYFRPDDEVLKDDLVASVKRYRGKYSRDGERNRYAVTLDLNPARMDRRFLGMVFTLLKKRRLSFRLIDEMIRLQLFSRFTFLIRHSRAKRKQSAK